MTAFLYSLLLQWRLDIRSKSLLITCYLVPLLFFFMMGGIFTSFLPETKSTLIASMTVMGVSMGTLIGVPPSLSEVFGSDIKKVYRANGVPLGLSFLTMLFSAFLHLLLLSVLLYCLAPILFEAEPPENPAVFWGTLPIFIITSLCVGGILGLFFKDQSKLTMVSQLVFLPSIMLSGILFPSDLLPQALAFAGNFFPATWAYRVLISSSLQPAALAPLLVIWSVAVIICIFLIKRPKSGHCSVTSVKHAAPN